MITIHKYQLTQDTDIDLPLSAEILSVGHQNPDDIVLWVKLNTESQTYKRRFAVYGTGHVLDERMNYNFIGTIQMNNGLVWHTFEILEKIH